MIGRHLIPMELLKVEPPVLSQTFFFSFNPEICRMGWRAPRSIWPNAWKRGHVWTVNRGRKYRDKIRCAVFSLPSARELKATHLEPKKPWPSRVETAAHEGQPNLLWKNSHVDFTKYAHIDGILPEVWRTSGPGISGTVNSGLGISQHICYLGCEHTRDASIYLRRHILTWALLVLNHQERFIVLLGLTVLLPCIWF